MSRTIRCQSGHRWWRDKRRSKYNMSMSYTKYRNFNFWCIGGEAVPYTAEEIEKEIQDDIIRYEKKGMRSYTPRNGSLKWHSNWFVRARNRAELHKVMTIEEYEYDNSHDRLKKKLIWNYD